MLTLLPAFIIFAEIEFNRIASEKINRTEIQILSMMHYFFYYNRLNFYERSRAKPLSGRESEPVLPDLQTMD